MKVRLPQRIQTPGIVKALEGYRRFKERFIGSPINRLQTSYDRWAAYSLARSAVETLKDLPETKGAFREHFDQPVDFKQVVRYLGTALSAHSSEWQYRGRISRCALAQAGSLINFILSSKYSITLPQQKIEDALLVESTTPIQMRILPRLRDFVWSLPRFPFYGFYLHFVEPLAYALKIKKPDAKYNLGEIQREQSTTKFMAVENPQFETMRALERKYSYVTAMANAVIDLMKAAVQGMNAEELGFEAVRLIVNAIPFMTRALLYRVKEVNGVPKAVAVSWAGKEGFYDLLVRAQSNLMKGKMVYDLVRDREARAVGLVEADAIAQQEALGEGGVLDTAMAKELRFTRSDANEQLAGTASLVALSIMDGRPFICTDVHLNSDGTATATDLITGETIHPNPVGMRTLNVFEFFVAPFEGGTLLGAVDLPKGVPNEEILHIMEAYRAYARILGMVIQSRLLTEKLSAAKSRIERLAKELRRFAPDEALEILEREAELTLVEKEYGIAFVDLSGSTRLDREWKEKPTYTHHARNQTFEQIQACLSQDGCQAFGFMGDAILAGIGAEKELTPAHVSKMLFSLVRTARRLVDRKLEEGLQIRYRMKMAVHGGLVSSGVLGTAERGQYTLIGYPVDVAARLTEVFKDWGKVAPELHCRVETDKTLPILVSEPMMKTLLENPEGNNFLQAYVADFNAYILSGLLGENIYGELARILRPIAEARQIPLADLMVSVINRAEKGDRLKGYTPLTLRDLLKGPFDLKSTLGYEPKGMEGDPLGFYVLEWDIHAYHPNYAANQDNRRHEPPFVVSDEIAASISRKEWRFFRNLLS